MLHLFGGRAALSLRMLLLLVGILAALPAAAQSAGQLMVVVIDPEGLPIANASLQLSGQTLIGGVQERSSDAYGEALFSGLPAGWYNLTTTKSGFNGVNVDNIRVDAGRTATQFVRMEVGYGENISINAKHRAVDTSSTSTGKITSQEFLQRIPAGRTYESAVQAVPGVTGANPNMGGGAFNENTYMLYEDNVTSGGNPNMAGSMSAPMPTPPASLGAAGETRVGRMVHHNGWVALSVPNPRETLDAIVAIAERASGRTEQMSGNTVVVRVPVARFAEIWSEVLALGESLNQLVTADDVTDQFTALDLRLRVLQATRTRLLALLAQAKTESEKLRLLMQITRVTEEIDTIDAQLRTISDLATMSRITVEAVARDAFSAAAARPEAEGIEWIPVLSPFRRDGGDGHRVALPVPDKMVSLSQKGPLVAESSGGTVWWTARMENDPVGTAAFWIDTLADRLASEFANPTQRQIGGWRCLSLDEPGTETPYRWEICVEPHGNKLHVSQSYFPTADELGKYGTAIDHSLTASGGGA